MAFQTLFATRLYQAKLSTARNRMLEKTCLGLAAEDRAGRRWAREHGYGGYTSYASLNDLPRRASLLAELERDIARHIAIFARDAQFELKGRKLALDSLWINVMEKGAIHASHIHPHSVVSGTYYVTVPAKSGAIRFEDPRLAMLMAAPSRKKSARVENRTFVSVEPRAGMLLLWETWLRHGVDTNGAETPRIAWFITAKTDEFSRACYDSCEVWEGFQHDDGRNHHAALERGSWLVQLVIASAAVNQSVGLPYNLSSRDQPAPPVGVTAGRLQRALNNFRETFGFFAVAVIVVVMMHKQDPMSALGAQLYFWARLIYVPVYAFGIQIVRTIVWAVSVVGIVLVLLAALGMA